MSSILLGVTVLLSLMKCGQSSQMPTLISITDINMTSNEVNSIEGMIFPTLDPNIAEDAKLTTPQLIKKYGYDVEIHHVITEDGYILELHRITGSPRSPSRDGKKVAFLMHGLLDSSATWVMTGTTHGLGYLLADAGYDVWLGNARGNRYSCNHTKYQPFGSSSDRKHFWSFSWHEIGVHDLPVSIDYVLGKTKRDSLQFIGHSQGTTAFFVMCAEKPEYNSKISIMHALAPVGFLSHVFSPPIRVIAPFVSILRRVSSLLGLYDVAPTNKFLILAGKDICRDKVITQSICENILFLIMGYTSDQLNATLLPVILGHTPAGSAINQLLHYGQEVDSGKFRKFDYGRVENLIRYKHTSPPDYDLNNIRTPVALYYSQDDWLATVKDTEHLLKTLPNVVESYLVPHKKFNHVDFVWGCDAPALLYSQILKTMDLAGRNEYAYENDVRK